MLKELQNKSKEKMQMVIMHLKDKLKKLRTGRAHISLLDGIKVQYYGNSSELSHIASLSCPDAGTLMIAPWDQNALKSIEEALVKSSLGMAPQNDGKVIRLKVPELTEDRRQEIIKVLKKDIEKSRVEIRQIRQETNNTARQLLKQKTINEDECRQAEDEVQKQTNQFNAQIDEMSSQKEKELTQI